MGISRPSGPKMPLVLDGGCSGRDEEGVYNNDPQVWSWGNLSVNVGLFKVGEGLPWVGLGTFGV